MSPMIKDGDEISLIRVTADAVRFSDIIACRKKDGLMTHRLLVRKKKSGKGFIVTKGDNCSNCDEALEETAVWGKVIGIKRGDKITDLEKPSWRTVSFMTALFSFLEWKIYQAVVGKRELSPSIKRPIKAAINGPKKILFRLMVFISGGK